MHFLNEVKQQKNTGNPRGDSHLMGTAGQKSRELVFPYFFRGCKAGAEGILLP